MNKTLMATIIIILIAGLGFAGWYFFIRKAPEGGRCQITTNCQTGLKCANKTCSSGKANSSCATYKDCNEGLYCKTNVCIEKPLYTQYFDKLIISKMKPGLPPGPNNPTTVTSEFKSTDGIEMDFVGVKSSTTGEFYYEFADSNTGKTIRSGIDQKQQFDGRDRGTGTDLASMNGKIDLNIYYNDALIYTVPITISQ